MFRQGLVIFLLITFFIFNAFSHEPKINVRIAKSLPQVTVKGFDLQRKFSSEKKGRLYKGKKIIQFNCERSRRQKALIKKPRLVASVSTLSGVIDWNDQKYRGKFHLLTSAEHDSCDLVNEQSLETYISALLSKEMRNDWPLEALKAQAIAARTYAYHKIKTKQVSQTLGYQTYFDLENSEKHQVNGTLLDESKATRLASKETEGRILKTKSGKITPIFFHSKCGGRTIVPRSVWENRVEGYQSVDCPYCHDHGHKPWKIFIDEKSLKTAINSVFTELKGGETLFSSSEMKRPLTVIPDRNKRASIRFYKAGKMYTVKKSHLRRVLGRKTLPSNNFEIQIERNGYQLVGTGYGHGVGMCQFGALELAKRGLNYKQILAYYFPGHKIEKIY